MRCTVPASSGGANLDHLCLRIDPFDAAARPCHTSKGLRPLASIAMLWVPVIAPMSCSISVSVVNAVGLLRASSAAFANMMRRHEGKALEPLLRDAGVAILQESPHRVVESALARIEVFTRIPLIGEKSPRSASCS